MIPVTHELKIYKEYADAIISGEKTFELRLNDRHYHEGDMVKFIEVSAGRPVEHPITEKLYKITYLISGWGLKDDWVAFSIKEIDNTASGTQVITREVKNNE